MAESQVGPFLLGKKLGGGGMGIVYRATYAKNGKVVALKLLPEDLSSNERLVARFDRELEILKKLRHPNIVPCFGGGRHGGQRYIAMELVEGGSLAERLQSRGRFSWEEVVRYGQQVCSALSCAHEHAIIHRDLKPANLLLTKNGQLKLADFGIARDTDATGLTADGKTVGTFAYMAPEQFRGGEVTHKADLYSLGCVLFELLTGQPPFDGQTQGELMYKHLNGQPPRVSAVALDCPIWLDGLIVRLLDKDPGQRPRDAGAVFQALTEVEEKVAQGASVLQHAASRGPTSLNVTAETDPVRKLLKPRKKKKAATGPIWERTWFLATCLAGVVGLVVWSLWPAGEQKLFEQARVLMESEEPNQWRRAVEKPLAELQRRFPEGTYATEIQQYVDKYEMHVAEERLKYNRLKGNEPKNEGERLYANARQYELFGDLVTAFEKYRGIVDLMGDQREARPYVNLARRQMSAIESSSAGHLDRRKLVDSALAKADELYADGKAVEAHKVWNSIVTLYGENRELRPQVENARRRLADKDAGRSSSSPNSPDTP
ncbi:MAG: serine/threonine-protein kinase [Planctomycetales bacterium]